MSESILVPLASAFWLGILTSISPCPLTTNIAAISYVGRRVGKPASVLQAGLLYTAGRTLAYLLLGMLLVGSLLSAPSLSQVLQKHMNMALGPMLIVVGLILLELIPLPVGSSGLSAALQNKADSLGIGGAGLLGMVFALSFCPTSAALFFGSLLPLAVQQQSGILLPGVYGLATGLPVLLFALLLAFGTNKVAQAFNRIAAFEIWARRITGLLFVLIGGYYCAVYFF
ncbi:MAG: Cytochrome C biogenesis protein transmembrane region [Candidatus Electronema aureum]|uniref:Cytochrome C biogenesis protein transmembrane region n=1 Tax=Candidatus Electronema aureum TaxID=2005002 RepID=A0A521G2B7_9BACT|nr:MAG: Cytochrome C biogenesis protein transmembrane region [Candidatus Electronema aureum]